MFFLDAHTNYNPWHVAAIFENILGHNTSLRTLSLHFEQHFTCAWIFNMLSQITSHSMQQVTLRTLGVDGEDPFTSHLPKLVPLFATNNPVFAEAKLVIMAWAEVRTMIENIFRDLHIRGRLEFV